jgi:hypothetical protein
MEAPARPPTCQSISMVRGDLAAARVVPGVEFQLLARATTSFSPLSGALK